MVYLSRISSLQLPWLLTDSLSSSLCIYFSVWAALHGHCSVCPLLGLSSLVEVSTGCHTADSNTHAMQTHEDIHDTIVAGSSATHIVLAYVVTYMGLACSKKYSDKPDPHRECTRMPVCILSPQWESPVSSCLAWVSAAHKHTGGPLLQILGIYRYTWHGGMSHGFNPTRKPPQRAVKTERIVEGWSPI